MGVMTSCWVLVLLAGCAGGKTTARATAPKTANTETTATSVCIDPAGEAATIAHATAQGSKLAFCIGTSRTADPKQCIEVDLQSRAYHRLDKPPAIAAGPAHVETTMPRLDVCVSGSCTSLVAKVMPEMAAMRAATNNDGSQAVVLLGDAERGRGYAEVWDVGKKQRTGKFRYAHGIYRCGDVAMLGTSIYLSAAQCNAPAARARLYNLRGRQIANVGGRDFGSFGNAFVQVDGDTWAFLSENANKLVFQDVAKGTIVKRIDTSKLFGQESGLGTPGESTLTHLPDGRLVVIAGSPATGSLAIVDPKSDKLDLVPAPACKGVR